MNRHLALSQPESGVESVDLRLEGKPGLPWARRLDTEYGSVRPQSQPSPHVGHNRLALVSFQAFSTPS